MITFEDWLAQVGLSERLTPLHIVAAFEVMVARMDGARAAGAIEPLRTVSTRQAGPHSRAATRRMLEQLGYSPAQRRIVHRLLAGSPSGWPGILVLFANGAELAPEQRRYIQRQVRSFGKPAGSDGSVAVGREVVLTVNGSGGRTHRGPGQG